MASSSMRDHRLERLSTGVAALDGVLDGGIPARSVTVIAGEPGSGKTVLALQMAAANARQGGRCLYFTTLSEPSLKFLRYAQLFRFFDPDLLQDRIQVVDLGSALRSSGLDGTLRVIREHVERIEPALVVVDSFRVVHDLGPDVTRIRAFVYDLAVEMATWGATTLLLGEYGPAELLALPESAVADGILRLGASRQELTTIRQLEIAKLRGSAFVSGIHYFEIGPDGVDFYPRVRGPDLAEARAPSDGVRDGERLSTGIPGLDELFGGGVLPRSSTIVMGGTGTGKTALGLHFLLAGARRGEPGALLALEEAPDQLHSIADGFGFDLDELERRDLVRIHYTAPIELSTDRFLHKSLQAIEARRVKRVVLDSLSSLALGAISERRYKELVYALGKHLRQMGATVQMNMEIAELLGTRQLSGHGVSFACDNLVQLRFVEMEGRLERALSVIKARGTELSTELRQLRITSHGVEVTPRAEFRQLHGVLTGLPTRGDRP